MNYVTREIMETFGLTPEDAQGVQYYLDCSGIDYSECSTEEYTISMKEAFNLWSYEQLQSRKING